MNRIVFLIVALLLIAGIPLGAGAVDVGINIGVPLPPLEFAGEPDVVVVPSGSTYVYMVPDMMGVYFYNGYWYRIHEGRWYRSDIYRGPWAYYETSRVPRIILDVPPDYYRHLPHGYQRIHYGDLHRNWRSWDNSRHWHDRDWYKQGHEGWRRDHQGDRGVRQGDRGVRQGDNRGVRQGDNKGVRQGDNRGVRQGDNRGVRQGDNRGVRQGDKGVRQGDNRGVRQGDNKGVRQGDNKGSGHRDQLKPAENRGGGP